jgi:hypothetical protein
MFASRASRSALRIGLALLVLLTSVAPVSARSMSIAIQSSSPQDVTAGLPVAYPVVASNTGNSTLNHVRIVGSAHASFAYLGAEPANSCSQTTPECNFGQLASGAALPRVTFYYRVPQAAGAYTFTATAFVNEGGGDNSDGSASAEDQFSTSVQTQVVPFSANSISGHSIPGVRTFSTGLTTVGATNPHGSTVTVNANAEVTVGDLAPNQITLACPAVAATCFGWGTSLDVADGAPVPSGIEVTVRWDASQLPKGMTNKKLRIIHLFTGGGYEFVTNPCTFSGGVATNLPCIKTKPAKLAGGDIQATVLLLSNGLVRGW